MFLFFGLVAVNGSYYVQLERARLAAVRAVDRRSARWRPRSSSSTTSATSRPTGAPARTRSRSARTRARPQAVHGPDRRRVRRCCRSRLPPRTGPGRRCSALLSAPLVLPALNPVLNRTDGPALNGALAGDRQAPGSLQPAGRGRARDRRLGVAVGSRVRLESLEAVPYSLPFREPYVDRARGSFASASLCWSGCEARASRAWARRRRCRCGAAPGVRSDRRGDRGAAAGRRSPRAGSSPIGSGRRSPAAATAEPAHRPLAAVDIALHDLAGKATGQPGLAAAGRRGRHPGQVQRDAPRRQPGAAAERSPSAGPRTGFDTFKLKVGLAGRCRAGGDGERGARARGAPPRRRQRRLDGRGGDRATRGHGPPHARARRAAGRRPRADGRGAPGEPGPHRRRRERRHDPRTRAERSSCGPASSRP